MKMRIYGIQNYQQNKQHQQNFGAVKLPAGQGKFKNATQQLVNKAINYKGFAYGTDENGEVCSYVMLRHKTRGQSQFVNKIDVNYYKSASKPADSKSSEILSTEYARDARKAIARYNRENSLPQEQPKIIKI